MGMHFHSTIPAAGEGPSVGGFSTGCGDGSNTGVGPEAGGSDGSSTGGSVGREGSTRWNGCGVAQDVYAEIYSGKAKSPFRH
jgi:hypothetical protein